MADEATTTTASTTTTTTVVETTTTTVPMATTLSKAERQAVELRRDIALIRQIYRDVSDASFSGVDAIYEAFAAHNHPGEECTAEDYRTVLDWPDGTVIEYIVLPETVQPDPEWKVPAGRLDGQTPEGRIYIYQIVYITSFPDTAPIEDRGEVHAAIVDDEAHFFIPCFEL